jgi:hypothetical protein
MKITKDYLKNVIKEELSSIVEKDELSGPTRAGEQAKSDPSDPLAGPTRLGQQSQAQPQKNTSNQVVSKKVLINIKKQLDLLSAEINKVLGR